MINFLIKHMRRRKHMDYVWSWVFVLCLSLFGAFLGGSGMISEPMGFQRGAVLYGLMVLGVSGAFLECYLYGVGYQG